MSDSELNPKLEWMYKTGKDMVNREEYLLGKKVDKQFEESTGNAVESEVLPERVARINYSEFDKHKDQVDIARKQIEDPLMLIKQKEIEARRKILENPVKLKKLHELLKKDSTKTEVAKKKKKKEKKRSKSSSSSSSSGSADSDEDLDKLLLKKYRALQGKKSPDSNDGESFIDKKFQALTKELDKFVKKKKSKNQKRSPSSSPERRRNSPPPPSRRYNRSSPPRRRSRSPRRNNRSPIRKRSRSRSAKRSNRSPPPRRRSRSLKRSRSPRRDRNKSPPRSSHREKESRPGYGLVSAGGDKIELKSRDEVRWYSKSELKSSSRPEQKKTETRKPRESLTEDEKEKRRLEMMQNANWREKDRAETVKKYRKNEEKEEKDQQAEFDKQFLDKHLRKAQQQTNSLESRIKSNLNNIQRTTSTMNTNFAKR